MRISDWSSDVCSSDLLRSASNALARAIRRSAANSDNVFPVVARNIRKKCRVLRPHSRASEATVGSLPGASTRSSIWRSWADRKSVGEGKSVSVRVDLGGRRHITKKKPKTQKTETKHTPN